MQPWIPQQVRDDIAMKDNSFMRQAILKARAAAKSGEVPVGALLVREGEIIASDHNLVETNSDPTAHAEMLVIRAGCKILASPRLTDCDLYVTLEPCAMCAQAISFARIRRLYFAAYDEKGGGVEHGARIFSQSTCHHRPEIYGGIAESESGSLLKEFFEAKRTQK
jgi:tRNA(Arg) A34 adenosine deaminase TadA